MGANPISPNTIIEYNSKCDKLIEAKYQEILRTPAISDEVCQNQGEGAAAAPAPARFGGYKYRSIKNKKNEIIINQKIKLFS